MPVPDGSNGPTTGHGWVPQPSCWHLCRNVFKKGQKELQRSNERTKGVQYSRRKTKVREGREGAAPYAWSDWHPPHCHPWMTPHQSKWVFPEGSAAYGELILKQILFSWRMAAHEKNPWSSRWKVGNGRSSKEELTYWGQLRMGKGTGQIPTPSPPVPPGVGRELRNVGWKSKTEFRKGRRKSVISMFVFVSHYVNVLAIN